jgi:hypothetical protein
LLFYVIIGEKMIRHAAAFAVLGLLATPVGAAEVQPDKPMQCEACAGWNQPHAAFRVFGNACPMPQRPAAAAAPADPTIENS